MSKRKSKPSPQLAARSEDEGLPPDDGGVPAETLALLEQIRREAKANQKFPDVAIELNIDPANTDAGYVGENHVRLLSGLAYAKFSALITAGTLGVDHPLAKWAFATAPEALAAFVERVNPRDPIEQALAEQAALANVRSVWLQSKLASTNNIDTAITLADYADRATNSFRRLTLALAEYRSPRKTTIVSMRNGQTNVSDQQVIQNQFPNPIPNANELGAAHVSLNPERPALPSADHCPQKPLAEIHRPANAPGQGAVVAQQLPTRRTKSRGSRASTGDGGAAQADPRSAVVAKRTRTILKTLTTQTYTTGQAGKGSR